MWFWSPPGLRVFSMNEACDFLGFMVEALRGRNCRNRLMGLSLL